MLKYLAAFALASIAGDASKPKVLAILKSAGSVDAAEFDSVWPALEGKNLNTLVAEGSAKLSASSGASSSAAAAPAAAGAAPAAAAKKEAPKEEEGDDDMGFGLFD